MVQDGMDSTLMDVTVRLMLCWLQGLECIDVVTVQVAAMVPLRSL